MAGLQRVLIVDDHDDNRNFLSTLLAGRGYQVDQASDGQQALKLARKRSPDLVISDVMMPVMDGFELCWRLRADAQLCSLPFMLYTATYTDQADRNLAQGVGVDRYIVKPIANDELVREVEDMLSIAVPPPHTSNLSHLDFLHRHGERVGAKLEEKTAELDLSDRVIRRQLDALRGVHKEMSEYRTTSEQSARDLERLAEMSLDLICVCGFDGELRNFNRAVVEMTGLEPETLQSCWFLELLHPEDHHATLRQIATLACGNPVRCFYNRVVSADGSIYTVMWAGVPDLEHGQFQAIGRDVTAVQRAEEQRREMERRLRQSQRLQTVGTLAAGLAHDLCNVLMPIQWSLESVVEDARTPSHLGDDLRLAISATEQGGQLVHQILTFCGQVDSVFGAVDLGKITTSTTTLVDRLFRRATLQVDVGTHYSTTWGDSTQLQQVVMNLCTNACQASDDNGTVRVSLAEVRELPADARLSQIEEAEGYLRLVVDDDGDGIPPEVLRRVFEPFFTTKAPGRGTGLGLSVSHGIVRRHGGQILVETEPGEGATFEVWLPIRPCAEAPEVPSVAPSGTDRSLLLIEDDADTQAMVARGLRRSGLDVVATGTAAAGLEALRERERGFDVVVADFVLPDLNGHELIQRIRSFDPDLPIIVMTAHPEARQRKSLAAAGVYEVLAKPVAPALLLQTIFLACRTATDGISNITTPT